MTASQTGNARSKAHAIFAALAGASCALFGARSRRCDSRPMHEYRVYVLRPQSPITTVMLQQSDAGAIRAARRRARGCQFEVWRGADCISGIASLTPFASV